VKVVVAWQRFYIENEEKTIPTVSFSIILFNNKKKIKKKHTVKYKS